MEAGDDEQEEEPEPERDVDLVVDHVDGQHAQTVKPEGGVDSGQWTGHTASAYQHVQTHSWMDPDTPKFWKEHFVTLGNILTMGSVLSSSSKVANFNTENISDNT